MKFSDRAVRFARGWRLSMGFEKYLKPGRPILAWGGGASTRQIQNRPRHGQIRVVVSKGELYAWETTFESHQSGAHRWPDRQIAIPLCPSLGVRNARRSPHVDGVLRHHRRLDCRP